MALSKINRTSLDTGIDDNSDATAITIDSSERILMPNQPSFLATSDTTKTITSGNTLSYDTTAGGGHNIGSHYSTSTYKFTAPVNGVYFFTYSCRPVDTSTAGIADLIVNDAINDIYARLEFDSSDDVHQQEQTSIINLSEKVTAKVYIRSGSIKIDNDKYYGHFGGHLLG